VKNSQYGGARPGRRDDRARDFRATDANFNRSNFGSSRTVDNYKSEGRVMGEDRGGRTQKPVERKAVENVAVDPWGASGRGDVWGASGADDAW